MGLGVVLLLWLMMVSVAALVSSAILHRLILRLTSKVDSRERSRLITFAWHFPLLLALYGFLALVGYGTWSEAHGGDFAGLGDSASCPLPNGYRLVFGDLEDMGYLYPPGSGSTSSDSIERLQVDGPLLFASSEEHSSVFPSVESQGRFFVLDTATQKRTEVTSLAALQQIAALHHVSLDLKPAIETYQSNRFSRSDIFILGAMTIPPLTAVLYFLVWIGKVRRIPLQKVRLK